MDGYGSDTNFVSSIPEFYDTLLVPLIFEHYAADLATRLAERHAARPLADLLEIAAGTGVVTRALASSLPESVSIVATDLSPAMLAQAETRGTARPVTWRQADAMALPFEDASFDAVVCEFGAMFFPDRSVAYSEVYRVLRPGGIFIFNVWDRIEENEFADVVERALAPLFPDDPPRFLSRTPHGYHDQETIRRDLAAGGFTATPVITTLAARSRADSPTIPARAYCEGTVVRTEIESANTVSLEEATAVAAEAIAGRFGRGMVDGKIQAHVVTVEK
jgi:ubiquinone/menaquinone biosynthesis C-methylase UbiE